MEALKENYIISRSIESAVYLLNGINVRQLLSLPIRLTDVYEFIRKSFLVLFVCLFSSLAVSHYLTSWELKCTKEKHWRRKSLNTFVINPVTQMILPACRRLTILRKLLGTVWNWFVTNCAQVELPKSSYSSRSKIILVWKELNIPQLYRPVTGVYITMFCAITVCNRLQCLCLKVRDWCQCLGNNTWILFSLISQYVTIVYR